MNIGKNIKILLGIVLLHGFLVAAQVPSNDACSNGIEITSFPFTESATTASATSDFGFTTCSVTSDALGIWYTFTGADKAVTARVTQSSFNTIIAVFSGSCNQLTCEGSNQLSGNLARYSWLALSGVQYHVLVSGLSAAQSGAFTLEVEVFERPPNDSCETTVGIATLPFSVPGTTIGAFPDFDFFTCGIPAESRGVWYNFTGGDTIVKASVTQASFNSELAYFSGSCGALSCLGSNDASGSLSSVTFLAEAGTPYFILVSGNNGFSTVGTCNFQLIEYDRPPNDSCEDSVSISSLPFSTPGTTIGAFPDFGFDTCGILSASRGVWYNFTGADTITRASITQSSFNSEIAVFQGTQCATLSCVGSNDASGALSSFTFIASSGISYYVHVTGNGGFGTVGSYNFVLDDFDRPPNDSCDTATLVESLPFSIPATTEGAFPDFDFNTCGINSATRGIWYKYVGLGNSVRAAVTQTDFNTEMALFTGTCASLVCVTSNDASGALSSISFNTTLGDTYYLLVTGNSGFGTVGDFNFQITETATGPPTTPFPTPSPTTPPPVAPSPTTAPTLSMVPTALDSPSMIPSVLPDSPTMIPSVLPTSLPTFIPSDIPTLTPSYAPSYRPSMKPSAPEPLTTASPSTMPSESQVPSVVPTASSATSKHQSASIQKLGASLVIAIGSGVAATYFV